MAASTSNNPAYAEALDDVHTRFILNLPPYELRSAPRIFFQLEQAWWFYDDFLCDGAQARGEPSLPRFKHVKPFSLAMFHFSPLLEPMLPQFERMYDEYSTYKRSISTYGTILLNAAATKVVLCRVYKGKSWTLPGGKVNQHERGKDAAARETYEETGFDPESERGACAVWKARRERGEVIEELREAAEEDTGELLPWRPLQDTDKLVYTEKDTDKRRTCYVCRGVPETFPFEPVARKEVSEVGWHGIDALPKHTYAVLPFVNQLKRWIKRDNRKRGIDARGTSRAGSRGKRAEARSGGSAATPMGGSQGKPRKVEEDECGLTPFFSDEGNAPWEDTGAAEVNVTAEDGGGTPSRKDKKRDQSTGKKGRAGSKGRPASRSGSRAGSRGRQVSATDPLVESALAVPGESDRWTADQMFATNEQILGKKFTYDGNPHDFAERGFDVVPGEGRVDPHAFRVVGGGFMNSGEVDIGAPPEAAALQPLMHARRRSLSGEGKSDCATAGEDDMELMPFFSDDGKAPWEEGAVGGIQKAREPAGQSNSKGLALLSQLRQGTSANEGCGDGGEKATKDKSRKKGQGKTDAEPKGDKGGAVDASVDEFFLTDREITAKSQAEKLSILPPPSAVPSSASQKVEPRQIAQAPPPPEDEHLAWMRQWARQLPQAGPTKEFGDFRLDVGTVMSAMAAATQ